MIFQQLPEVGKEWSILSPLNASGNNGAAELWPSKISTLGLSSNAALYGNSHHLFIFGIWGSVSRNCDDSAKVQYQLLLTIKVSIEKYDISEEPFL